MCDPLLHVSVARSGKVLISSLTGSTGSQKASQPARPRGHQGYRLPVVHMHPTSTGLSRCPPPPLPLHHPHNDRNERNERNEHCLAPKPFPLHLPRDTIVTGHKLDPLKSIARTNMAGLPPPLPPPSTSSSSQPHHSIHHLIRSRRSSQDEIRALLARTTQALDKIVSIRESMEDVVDFKQFEAKALRLSRPSRVSSSIAELGAHSARSTPASSYNSTEASSSLSEDTLAADRSTSASSSSSLLSSSSSSSAGAEEEAEEEAEAARACQ